MLSTDIVSDARPVDLSARSRRPRSLFAIAATFLLAASLAACSPTPAPRPSGGTTNGSASQPGGGDAGFAGDRDAYDLKLAECLRRKGLDIADPQPGKGIQETGPEIFAAVPACMDEVGDPPVSGGKLSDAAQLDIWLQEVDCFRKRGFEVEDPGIQRAYTLPADATEEDFAACLVS